MVSRYTSAQLVVGKPMRDRCNDIADQVVPQYRAVKRGGTYYTCTGTYAKRWQAAWDGAWIALGGNPKDSLK